MPVLSAIVNYWRGTPSPPAADPADPYPKSHQETAHAADDIQNDDQKEMKTRSSKTVGTGCAMPPDPIVSENQSTSINTTSTEEVQRPDDSNGMVDTPEKQNERVNEIESDECSTSEDAEITKITNTMEEVEKAIQEETKREQEQIVFEGEKEWKSVADNQRYRRLQHLLDKSGIYCQFLLDRMESQKIEAAKRNERLSKKQEKEQNEKNNPVQQVPHRERRVTRRAQGKSKSSGGPPETPVKTAPKKPGHGRRRKADDSSYMISEYIDKESLSKRQKLSEEGNWKDNATGNTESSNCLQCVPDITDEQAKGGKTGGSSSNVQESQNHSLSTVPPKFLTGGTLRQYQLQGLAWLKVLYENGMNGILADEMGLGKTIQCISMLAHLIEMGVKGPYLVAAPLSTLPNWITEFNKFAPKIPVVLYHGSIEDRLRMRYKLTKLKLVEGNVYTLPVVITSYEICMRDQKSMHHLEWKYIIVDEGHRIKNLNCKLIRELKTYRAANRLLLTGTPLQNNLSELWSLLNFLLPDIFDDLESFQKWFDFSAINEEDGNERIIAQEREHQVLQRLHAILTPFLLRRLKADVELAVPPKKEVLVYAPLTKKQELFYKTTLDRTIVEMLKNPEKETEATVELSSTGRPKRKGRKDMNYKLFFEDNIDEEELNEFWSQRNDFGTPSTSAYKTTPSSFLSLQMRNICMQLRKCCNHPYLLECPLDQASMLSRIDEELVTSSGKLLLLDRMLPALKQDGHKVLLFSQMTRMMDILEDYCVLRKYDYSRLDGTMKISDRQSEIDKFNSDPNVFVFILSTRAGGLGINLAKADTVIIYDSDWNPQVDLQAQDRCHRIGQTKPVVVYRLVTANTVDQRVVERAATKRKLEKMIIHKGKFKGKQDTSVLGVKELRDLLESGYHDKVVSSEGLVISDDELKALLDRTDLMAYGKKRQQANSTESNAQSTLFKVLESPAQP